MKERLNIFMQEEGLTAAKLAEVLDVQPSAISHLLSGRNKPSFDFLAKLFEKFPNLNEKWFMLGKGSIHKDHIPVPHVELIATKENSMKNKMDGAKSEKITCDEIEMPASIDPICEAISRKNDKTIDKIILLYSDGSFESYQK